jgi:hypothetical protein
MYKFFIRHPSTVYLAGPTGSGKTEWLKKLLEENLIYPKPEKIYYCYSEWQPIYDNIKLSINNVEFIEGLLDSNIIDKNINNVIILDDLMSESADSKLVLNFFSKWSHHRNATVFLVTQNIFFQGKSSKTIRVNSHYKVLFNNPSDRHQIIDLARRMYPFKSKFLVEAYYDACSNPFGYLIIDSTQETPELLRVQTGIFSNEQNYVYSPK